MRYPLECCDFSETSAMMLEGLVRFLSEDIDFKAVVCLILAGVSLVVSSGFQLYTKIRPRFPVTVNCWFCNSDSKVHFKSRNSWTCPKCEQYNGFTQSGDYNKTIPAQMYEGFNRVVQSVKWEPYCPTQNGLCRKCNINQELKVQQLASFVPIVKANFDEEIELYRQRLETAYRLCAECDTKLSYKLNTLSAWVGRLYPPKVILNTDKPSKTHPVIVWTSRAVRLFSSAAALLACFLAAVEANRITPLWTVPIILDPFITSFSNLSLGVSVFNLGLALMAAALTKSKLHRSDLAASFLWFLTAVLDLASNRVAGSHVKRFTVAHIAVTVVACLATVLVHVRYLLAKSEKSLEVAEPIVKPQEPVERPFEPIPDAPEAKASSELEKTLTACQVPDSPVRPVQSSLHSLSLGPSSSPPRSSSASIFETRVYKPGGGSSLFLEGCEPVRRRKPIVHPPKFNPWNNSYCVGPVPLSRSSSQSSGFISQNGTNYSSVPNSRSGSVCGDADRFSVLSEPIYPSASFKSLYTACPAPPPSSSPLSVSFNSSAGSATLLNESLLSHAGSGFSGGGEKTVFCLVQEHFGLATVFLCSIVFNAVVIALAVANSLSTPPLSH
ncbi:Hypothetical predicted protein [Cloeon dipterum]|uniref:Ima1 N-terminal domain-containing protein n=1 Tax=Cloeon dipterum TaxID=197152 RepID=A0A8S1DDU3_9INSE|nr:Hypothetical predicted protein [Cloeon dipterum]